MNAREHVSGGKGRSGPWLPWAVTAAWLLGSGIGLWHLQSGPTQAGEVGTATLPSLAAEQWLAARAPSGLTVVSILTPGCTCNANTARHVAQIEAGYAPRGVRLVRAERTAQAEGELAWAGPTPAAAVYDAAGRLVYLGPYSTSAWCGGAGGLVEAVLEQLLAGHTVEPWRAPSGGCACISGRTT